MAINATTLSAAAGLTDTTVAVASATGITGPNNQTGAGVTYLQIDNEVMFVTAVNGLIVSVLRGQLGTYSQVHASGVPVLAGLPSDFAGFTPTMSAFVDAYPNNFAGISAPVASANTITASGPVFHVTGATLIKTINLPTGMLEGTITIIFDGAATFDATGNIGSATTAALVAGSAVTFTYDRATSKWYPSRTA